MSRVTMSPSVAEQALTVMQSVCKSPCAQAFLELQGLPDVSDLNAIALKLVNDEYQFIDQWDTDVKNLADYVTEKYEFGSVQYSCMQQLMNLFEKEKKLLPVFQDVDSWISNCSDLIEKGLLSDFSASIDTLTENPVGAVFLRETEVEFDFDTNNDAEDTEFSYVGHSLFDVGLLDEDAATPKPADVAISQPNSPYASDHSATKMTQENVPQPLLKKGGGIRIRLRREPKAMPSAAISPASAAYSPVSTTGQSIKVFRRARKDDDSSDEYMFS